MYTQNRHAHTYPDTHTHKHTHAQADRHYLNSSGAKCQMSSGPLGPIFYIRQLYLAWLFLPVIALTCCVFNYQSCYICISSC